MDVMAGMNSTPTTATPLISIIIPVYNVEAYLRECVDSVLAQTYSDLEIILVDDGSTDGSAAICDEYATRDPRVRVIHKANGGLSDARNVGLDAATGDYIGFVDSDDWCEQRMFELLMQEAQAYDADIVVCAYYSFETDPVTTEENMWISGPRRRYELTTRDAMVMLLKDKEIQNYVWNKLYRAELWDGVRFPVGQKFEDINTAYKVFEKAERVAVIPYGLYYYRMRTDSIVKSGILANEIDCVDANMQRYEALCDEYPEARGVMVDAIFHALVRVWPLVWIERKTIDDAMRAKLTALSAFVRDHWDESHISEELGWTGRQTLKLTQHNSPWSWWRSWILYHMYLTRHEYW